MNRENFTTEYKKQYTEDIKKTIIAFANTQGGNVYIGIADDGSIEGIVNPDETMLKVTNCVRDTIRPDITMHMSCDTRQIDGSKVVVVQVQKGSSCPYYLAIKGIRPEGVFVRQGSSTVPATENAILKMIKETSGDNYEISRSLIQDLEFTATQRFFEDENIKFGTEQKKTLGIIGTDGAFTNVGLLLSDQCLHTIKMAVFEGCDKMLFKDRTEFSGSVLKQLEASYDYLDRFNKIRSEFLGLKRIDLRDYPSQAIRETLLNTLVHRDYSYSASILISIFDDRIEFVSLGGLPKGISYNDLKLGVSVLRNTKLADVFYRLHLIEAYGTGILKIMESYKGLKQQPVIEISDNAFKITLPNSNYIYKSVIKEEAITSYGMDIRENSLTSKEQKVLDHLTLKNYVARKEIEDTTSFSQATTIRILNNLMDKNLVIKQGIGKSTTYSLINR